MVRTFARNALTWTENMTLKLGKRRLAQVVPDATYAGMWRVQTADGQLTDMTNLTRAKDAAMLLALGMLNRV